VVYVSPLKAPPTTSEEPSGAARRDPPHARTLCLPDVVIRTLVRTGDTPARSAGDGAADAAILVTTPDRCISSSRRACPEMLRSVRTVIVDEIHGRSGDKRRQPLALTLERLGTSPAAATADRPLGDAEADRRDRSVLVGANRAPSPESRAPSIIDSGHAARPDLAIEIPSHPLEAVMAAEVWDEIYERLVQLILEHRYHAGVR